MRDVLAISNLTRRTIRQKVDFRTLRPRLDVEYHSNRNRAAKDSLRNHAAVISPDRTRDTTQHESEAVPRQRAIEMNPWVSSADNEG